MLGQGGAELTGALVGGDDGADQLVKSLRLLTQGERQRLTLLDLANHRIQRLAHRGLAFLLAQGVQRFQQGDAGIEQHRQLLAEQLQREAPGRTARRAGRRGAGRAQLLHLQHMLGRHAQGAGYGMRVQRIDAHAPHPLGVKDADLVAGHEAGSGRCGQKARRRTAAAQARSCRGDLTSWSDRRLRPHRPGGRHGRRRTGRTHRARRASGTGSRCARGPGAAPCSDRGRPSAVHRWAW